MVFFLCCMYYSGLVVVRFSDREKLRATGAISSKTWPRFFYPLNDFDKEDLMQGFLQGELIVWVRITTGSTLSYYYSTRFGHWYRPTSLFTLDRHRGLRHLGGLKKQEPAMPSYTVWIRSPYGQLPTWQVRYVWITVSWPINFCSNSICIFCGDHSYRSDSHYHLKKLVIVLVEVFPSRTFFGKLSKSSRIPLSKRRLWNYWSGGTSKSSVALVKHSFSTSSTNSK
jgi:hypothetical protein